MAEGRPFTVDTAPATEFGSKQFHDKIEQNHHHQQQQQQPTQTEVNDGTLPFPSGSRFSLPLRGESKSEHDKKEKKGFFKLRHKVSFLHPKTSPSIDPHEPLPALPLRPSTESAARKTYDAPIPSKLQPLTDSHPSLPLDQLFAGLPNELQIQVISNLPLPDILNLRLSSKSWHSLITAHEGSIVRHHLQQCIPEYARKLYPVNDPTDFNFHYLCGLWHRLHVAAKLAYMMSEWITKDIFLRQSDSQRLAFASQHERMRRRLIPLLFTVFHYFETYRRLHLRYVEKHGHGLKMDPYTVNPIEKEIMELYDDQTLLRVHEIFPLVISSFCRRLRPPTYVGRVERSLRGYIREKPADDVHTAILCIGGMRQVERLWEIKGYNSRRVAVDNWYNSLMKDPPAEQPQHKTRRSLMSFGRKKSTSGETREGHREHHRSSFSSLHRARSPTGSIDAGSEYAFDSNWIFNTSLSAGVPMGSLSRDQAQTILDDLPVLQQIWMTTAEAMVLDRQIVGRPQDIKRNQAVMLDLIREDGRDERDEWGYGRKLHDSVRPPMNVVPEGDAD